MPRSGVHVAAKRQRERGSQVVEVALCLLPFLVVLFLMVDLSLIVFLKATFQHAVREGARYAITGRTMPGMGQDASIRAFVQTHTLGFLAGEDNAAKIKIRYYRPDTLAETQSNSPGNIVEISVEGYSWSPIAPLLRSTSPVVIAARSSDLVEPAPGGSPPPR